MQPNLTQELVRSILEDRGWKSARPRDKCDLVMCRERFKAPNPAMCPCQRSCSRPMAAQASYRLRIYEFMPHFRDGVSYLEVLKWKHVSCGATQLVEHGATFGALAKGKLQSDRYAGDWAKLNWWLALRLIPFRCAAAIGEKQSPPVTKPHLVASRSWQAARGIPCCRQAQGKKKKVLQNGDKEKGYTRMKMYQALETSLHNAITMDHAGHGKSKANA